MEAVGEGLYIATVAVTNPPREPARMLARLASQLERERRMFLVGGIAYAIANLAVAGLALAGLGGARLGWIPVAIAFLGNVFYALTAEWEMRWEAIWRREVPRIERSLGSGDVLTPIITERGPRRVQRWMKYLSWGLSAAWLVALLFAIRAAGLRFGLAG